MDTLQHLATLIKDNDINLDNNFYELNNNNNNNNKHKLIIMRDIILELKQKGQTQKIQNYYYRKIK